MIDLSNIDFVELLSELGLRNAHMTAGGVEVNYSCHRGEHSNNDESPSAYLNSEKGVFFCWGCKLQGTVVDLVASVQEVSCETAKSWLRDRYGFEVGEPIGGSMLAEFEMLLRPPVPPPEVTLPPESWLSSVRLDWRGEMEPHQQYMIDRGLSREAMEEFDVGFDYLSDRLMIPVRSLDGALVGAKGRDWTNTHGAKYLHIGDRVGAQRLRYGFGCYERSQVVFGLHRARDVRWTCLVEGELDCIALWQIGVPRPTATGGAQMSVRQRDLLIDEVELVYVYYDRGEAGEGGAEQVVSLIEPYVQVRVVEPLDVDPCDALRLGREQEVLDAIESARSPLARDLISV